MNHQIHLFGEFAVNLGNDGLHRLVGVIGDRRYRCQRLLCQGLYGCFHRVAGLVRLGLELLVQQRCEVVPLQGLGRR
ncbi:hypothetical protein D3C71_2022370 [compost metagenome]